MLLSEARKVSSIDIMNLGTVQEEIFVAKMLKENQYLPVTKEKIMFEHSEIDLSVNL